jgi:hypothetical protein
MTLITVVIIRNEAIAEASPIPSKGGERYTALQATASFFAVTGLSCTTVSLSPQKMFDLFFFPLCGKSRRGWGLGEASTASSLPVTATAKAL